MKLKDQFKALALRAGIKDDDANLVAALEAMPELEVNDELIGKINSGLITESEALNNGGIKSKFTAQALNGVDALVDPILSEVLTEEEITTLRKEEKATFKKVARLGDKIKELKASGKPADKNELNDLQKKYNQEIENLKKAAQDVADAKDKEINNLKEQHQRDRYFDKLAAKVVSRNDVTDYAKAKEGKRVIADLSDTLEQVGGIIDFETGKIMQKKDPTLELYVDNKAATVDTILQKTLADNDYLKKSDPAPINQVQVQTQQPNTAKITEAQRANLERLKEK